MRLWQNYYKRGFDTKKIVKVQTGIELFNFFGNSKFRGF